jgi:hypothetical protein
LDRAVRVQANSQWRLTHGREGGVKQLVCLERVRGGVRPRHLHGPAPWAAGLAREPGVSFARVKEKRVVILGAGFAGLELATRLSDSLADEVRVTLIDQNDAFSFGYSKLDVLFGRKATADVLLQYREISKDGVEFRMERVTATRARTTRTFSSSRWERSTTSRRRRGSRRADSSTTRWRAPSACATCYRSLRPGRS